MVVYNWEEDMNWPNYPNYGTGENVTRFINSGSGSTMMALNYPDGTSPLDNATYAFVNIDPNGDETRHIHRRETGHNWKIRTWNGMVVVERHGNGLEVSVYLGGLAAKATPNQRLQFLERLGEEVEAAKEEIVSMERGELELVEREAEEAHYADLAAEKDRADYEEDRGRE